MCSARVFLIQMSLLVVDVAFYSQVVGGFIFIVPTTLHFFHPSKCSLQKKKKMRIAFVAVSNTVCVLTESNLSVIVYHGVIIGC